MNIANTPDGMVFPSFFSSFEYELGEIIESVFPYNEVVVALRILNQCAWHPVFVAEGFETGTVEHESVLVAAHHPEELVLLLRLLHVGDELLGLLGVGS